MTNKRTSQAQKLTLWEMLDKYNIEIPKIQRDYAQGRKGKNELRRAFLGDLYDALVRRKNDLKLDFVYGTESNKTLQPLDGQQRLTTLWLLHWFVAFKAGILADEKHFEERKKLRKFTYQTRTSSADFCASLCDKIFPQDIVNITEYIKKQNWFFSEWNQDPTIQAMLRMLSGTPGNNDGIEPVFGSDDATQSWQILTNDCPVYFYNLNLSSLNLSDDLYIKMNARGKALSDFENFKADLIGYLASHKETDWQELCDVQSGYPIMLDTTWAHIFWRQNVEFWKNEENKADKDTVIEFKIDAPYYAFFNRVFLNSLILEPETSSDKPSNPDDYESSFRFSGNSLEKGVNEHFNYLYGPKEGNNAHDEKIEYNSFDKYCYLPSGEIPLSIFVSIRKIIDNYSSVGDRKLNDFFPERHKDDNFEFIPTYKKGDDGKYTIAPIDQVNRVVFYAVCTYLETGEFDKESFARWMRVVWNIIDDTEISTISAMVTRIRRIKRLAEGSKHNNHDIYSILHDLSQDKQKNAQVKEECVKAKAILDNKLGEETEQIIKKCEDNIFFSGSIRCLYRNGKNVEDWQSFNNKWTFVEANFNTRPKDATLMKKLFCYMTGDDFANTLWWSRRVFNNEINSWRYLFRNDDLYSAMHSFLMGEPEPEQVAFPNGTDYEQIIYSLAHTKLLDFVMDKIPYSWIRSGYHYHTAIFPSSTGVFLNAKLRDEVLSDFTITVSEDIKVPETSFLWCNDADFTYKGIRFRWKDNDDVCRIEGDNEVYTFSANKEMYDKDLYLGKKEVFEQLDQIVNSVIAQK